jgi:hypothetical protein
MQDFEHQRVAANNTNEDVFGMANSRKFQMVLNEKFWQLLNDLKRRRNDEYLSETIKEALVTLDWVESEKAKGRQVVSRPAIQASVVEYPSRHVPARSSNRRG